MHAIVERDSIVKALGFCDKLADRRSSIPVLANLRLAFSGSGASITTTNLDETAVVRVPAETDGKADITAPSDKVRAFVNKLAKGAQIKLEMKDDALIISSNRSRLSLQTIPSSDFPEFKDHEPEATFTLEAKAVLELFKRTQFAISTEETRYYLNGIFFAIHNKMLTAVATDGHRLAKVAVPMPEGAETLPGIIIPRGSIARLIDMASGGEPMTFQVSRQSIVVRSGEQKYRSKLIDGTFPDWQRVVPGPAPRVMTFERAGLAVVADRISTVITERGRALKVTIDVESEEFAVSAINPDLGSATEAVPYVAMEDRPGEANYCELVGMNSRYLLDILGTMTGENVQVHLHDAGSPLKFTDAGDPNALFVLMPMRV